VVAIVSSCPACETHGRAQARGVVSKERAGKQVCEVVAIVSSCPACKWRGGVQAHGVVSEERVGKDVCGVVSKQRGGAQVCVCVFVCEVSDEYGEATMQRVVSNQHGGVQVR